MTTSNYLNDRAMHKKMLYFQFVTEFLDPTAYEFICFILFYAFPIFHELMNVEHFEHLAKSLRLRFYYQKGLKEAIILSIIFS